MKTLAKSITAKDIMVTSLITLRPDTDLYEAMAKLLKHRISGAPVVDYDGRYLGVFSERTSIHLLMAALSEGAPTTEILPVVDGDAKTISPTTDLLTIMQSFLKTPYRRLPVLDDRGELIGQVSRRDVLRAVHKRLEQKEMSSSDSNILYLSGIKSRDDIPFV